MAFNEFYTDTGGNDLNSGSTTSTTAAVTSVNGDWGSVTANRFTPNGGGTPFSGVSVGDWGSIYLDAAGSLGYLAQVTAVNGGGATLDFSTTAKYGTSPTTGATGRSVKIGGAWQTPWAFIGTGTTAVYNSTRINIKAGTYPGTTTNRTFNNVGSATQVLMWRGYNTTIGDIDSNNSLTKPVLSWTTATINISGTKQHWMNLDFTCARVAGAAFTITDEIFFTRCRFASTNANAASQAVTIATTQGSMFNYCFFQATSVASRVVSVQIPCTLSHCVFTGGLVGVEVTSSYPYIFDSCLFINLGSHGITGAAAGRFQMQHCTFKGCAGDGARFAAAPSAGSAMRWCLFDTITGTAINQNSGANSQTLYMSDNDFAACGTNITGFGDHPNLYSVTESSSPAVSSTDPTFSATTWNGASLLREFENWVTTGAYWDVGGTQRQVTTGGGGGTTLNLYPVE